VIEETERPMKWDRKAFFFCVNCYLEKNVSGEKNLSTEKIGERREKTKGIG
jgi:hypothetical protein